MIRKGEFHCALLRKNGLTGIFFNRQPINQQFQRIETGIDNTLVLRNVQRHHEGNYTCQVRNALGTDSIVYQLFVHVPPGPPQLHATATSSTSVLLEWSIECKHSKYD